MKRAGIKIQGGYLSPRARKGEDSIRRRGNCHDNAVTESFFQLLNRERIQKRSTERGKKPAVIFLITSKCFITLSVSMVRVSKCHRRIMKIKIINDSEMSRLSVPIHVFVLSNFKLLKIARNADFHNEYH